MFFRNSEVVNQDELTPDSQAPINRLEKDTNGLTKSELQAAITRSTGSILMKMLPGFSSNPLMEKLAEFLSSHECHCYADNDYIPFSKFENFLKERNLEFLLGYDLENNKEKDLFKTWHPAPELPPEIWDYTLQFFKPNERQKLRLVCKPFNELIKQMSPLPKTTVNSIKHFATFEEESPKEKYFFARLPRGGFAIARDYDYVWPLITLYDKEANKIKTLCGPNNMISMNFSENGDLFMTYFWQGTYRTLLRTKYAEASHVVHEHGRGAVLTDTPKEFLKKQEGIILNSLPDDITFKHESRVDKKNPKLICHKISFEDSTGRLLGYSFLNIDTIKNEYFTDCWNKMGLPKNATIIDSHFLPLSTDILILQVSYKTGGFFSSKRCYSFYKIELDPLDLTNEPTVSLKK